MQKVTKDSPGIKFDQGKLRYDLMPVGALEGVVKILTFGAEKYDDNNWRKMENLDRYYAALMRHLEAVRKGEWLDPESGQPHLDHVMCNVVFLRELEWNKNILTEKKLNKFLDKIKNNNERSTL